MSPDCRITGAAFDRFGAQNKIGKYPLHFHLARDAPNAYLKNNVVYR
jgi:hypothetical protein